MRVLLDCVPSELQHAGDSEVVRQAVREFDEEEIFISVVSLGEITRGINLLEEGRRKRELQSWLHGLERDYDDRFLDIDADIAISGVG